MSTASKNILNDLALNGNPFADATDLLGIMNSGILSTLSFYSASLLLVFAGIKMLRKVIKNPGENPLTQNMDVLFYCAVIGLIYFISPLFKSLFLGFQGLSQEMADACFASSRQTVHYQFRAVLTAIADNIESGHFLGSAMMDLTLPQILYVVTLFLLILTYYIVSSIAVPLALMAFLMAPIAFAFEMLIEGILSRWLFFTIAAFMYPTVSGMVFLIMADMNLFGAAREGVINVNPFPGIMSNVFAIVYLGVVPTITGTLFFAPVLNFFSFVIGVINFIFTDFISGSINFIISKAKGGK